MRSEQMKSLFVRSLKELQFALAAITGGGLWAIGLSALQNSSSLTRTR